MNTFDHLRDTWDGHDGFGDPEGSVCGVEVEHGASGRTSIRRGSLGSLLVVG